MQHGHSTSSSSSQNVSGASGGSSGYTGTGLSSYSGKVEDMEFPYCPDANKYEKLAKIGQGTFGYVFFFLQQSQASEFLSIKPLKNVGRDKYIYIYPIYVFIYRSVDRVHTCRPISLFPYI